MAYTKQVWLDYDDTKSEIENKNNGAMVTADRMNHMENGIANSVDKTVFDETENKIDHIELEISERTIIDSGGNEATGFFRKYGDGTMVVYGRKPIFLNISTPYGSLYRTDLPTTISYPNGVKFDLTNCTPVVYVNAKGALTERYGDSTANGFGVYAIKPISTLSHSVTFEWEVNGRWKP